MTSSLPVSVTRLFGASISLLLDDCAFDARNVCLTCSDLPCRIVKRYLYLLEMPQDMLMETEGRGEDVCLKRLSEVLSLAHCFQLQALADFCANLFAAALTPKNAIHRLNFAIDHGLPGHVQHSVRVFVLDNILLIQVTALNYARSPALCRLPWRSAPGALQAEPPTRTTAYTKCYMAACRAPLADMVGCLWQKQASHTLDMLKRPETVDLAVELLKLALAGRADSG